MSWRFPVSPFPARQPSHAFLCCQPSVWISVTQHLCATKFICNNREINMTKQQGFTLIELMIISHAKIK
ncbi:prepilin-type N-terminal cleavage/methylation domain-containing protein [Pectobacterium carotovorum]|uniref:prepilin-type N-terminal cleavage/methylation domain-containing protein n=1 Tax=Pectobacterium carotovorum TaxID=554 RepID=UPI0015DDF2D8|nr:prepilin-type N-terminal cleavage/methylation domain-containing protein [Pectobacterium carotovorum]